MKFSIQADRLVIRISRAERESLASGGELLADFSENGIVSLKVHLQVYPGNEISWENLPGSFRLLLPEQILRSWNAQPERLGLVHTHVNAKGESRLLILELDLHEGKSSSGKKLNENTHIFLNQ